MDFRFLFLFQQKHFFLKNIQLINFFSSIYKKSGYDELAPPPNFTSGPANTPSTPSLLNPQVKDLVNLVTNQDMFKQAMKDVNIDPAKLPAGTKNEVVAC